jgi:pimeloyl-ACP methyl ester carboxylesterase
MPEIQLPTIRLYYEEHGTGDPILCIHGTSSSAMIWGKAVEELARLGRVIVYDRRGCTRSQRPQPYLTTSVSEHGDDAAALLDALAAIPAIVIGRSYGGEVAIDLALRYPERVRALVLLEAAILSLSPDAQRWAEEVNDDVQAAAATRGDNAVAEVFLRHVLGDATWQQFPQAAKRMFIDNSPAILAEFSGGGLHVDSVALARIQQPTLLVTATDSPEAFRQVADAMAAAIPNARTVFVGGGHLVNPAEPAVLSFIQDVLARA